MTRRAGRRSRLGVHPGPEVGPPLTRNLDLSGRDLPAPLGEGVEQDDQIVRAPVEHAVELRADVTTQLAKLAVDLRAVGKRKVRNGGIQLVESPELVS
jgi:hypothetical protein